MHITEAIMKVKELKEITENVHEEHSKQDKYEIVTGLLMALFAAILGITEIGDKKAEAKYIVSNNEKSNAYQWYQSKSIKQNIADGQKDMLQAILDSGAVKADRQQAVKQVIAGLAEKSSKYEEEKAEILGVKQAEKTVPEHAASAEKKDEKEKIISAAEWEEKAHKYHVMGNDFAMAALFLQLCLVIGAVSLMIHEKMIRTVLLSIFIASGTAGIIYSIIAYIKFFAMLHA